MGGATSTLARTDFECCEQSPWSGLAHPSPWCSIIQRRGRFETLVMGPQFRSCQRRPGARGMSPSPLCATRRVPSPTTGERAVRVLQVAPRFFPELGGIETHINEVTTRLAALPDIRVTVAVTDRSRTLPTCEMWGDVPILRRQAWPKDRDFYFSPGLARIISHGQWDIVHVQGVHTLVPVLAMRAAARANIPYVLTFHTGGSSLLSRRVMRSTQWRALGPLLRRSSQMLAVSRFEQRLFARSTGVSEDRIKVIRNGAGLPIANSETVPVPGRIVSCGRLERYKGHHRVM